MRKCAICFSCASFSPSETVDRCAGKRLDGERNSMMRKRHRSEAESLRTVTGPLEIKTDQRLPISETELVRQYKGRDIVVAVLEDGFFSEGERYRSLSAIAKVVTGTNCNGFDFFGLKKGGRKG